MGLGVYHSGIEVFGREISFGYSDDSSTGVFEVAAFPASLSWFFCGGMGRNVSLLNHDAHRPPRSLTHSLAADDALGAGCVWGQLSVSFDLLRQQVPGRCAAGVMPNITFKEAVVMGTLNRSRFELDHLLQRLATKYRGDTYDLVRHATQVTSRMQLSRRLFLWFLWHL